MKSSKVQKFKSSKVQKFKSFKQLFFICLIFLGLFLGCRQEKEEPILNPTPLTLNKDRLKTLENWYAGKINPLVQQKDKSIIFHPKWGEGVLQALNDGTQLAIFPVW